MNYHKYYPLDVINGPGTRATLFVSGCEHQCRGCYNQATWDPRGGHEFDLEMQNRVISDLQETRIKRRGLSLSGGDPLHPQNLNAILSLVQRVKQECPGKDIWMWTGYLLADLTAEQKAVVEHVDTLIDGKFEELLADPSLKWRGSENQLVWNLSEIRESSK